jgi:hypothetical protein
MLSKIHEQVLGFVMINIPAQNTLIDDKVLSRILR